jgi:ribonucleotide reductase alpha subunit
MNLAAYVKNKKFDYENFGKDVRVAVRFLDNVIDDTIISIKKTKKLPKILEDRDWNFRTCRCFN